MSNFRFISYLYEYKMEQKGRNTGFVRVRGLNDFIELNMQVKPAKGTYQVYVHYETLPEVKSIFVGTIRAVNGECHGVFHNILPLLRKEGLSFSAIEALTVWQDQVICHGTQWSESKCLDRLLQKTSMSLNAEELKENKEDEWEIQGDIRYEESFSKEKENRQDDVERLIDKIVDGQEKTVKKEIEERESNKKKEIGTQSLMPEETEREGKAEKGTKSEEIERERKAEKGAEPEETEREGKAEKGTKSEETERSELKGNEIASEEAKLWVNSLYEGREGKTFDTGWPKPGTIEELMLQLKTIPSFGNDDFLKCVKIMPKDIGLLNADDWYLGKNSFLLHGYFAYQYLMLGYIKFQDGGKQAVIGVPGVYNSKDKYLAELFGFTNFIQAKKQEIKTGTFGYWITSVHENI